MYSNSQLNSDEHVANLFTHKIQTLSDHDELSRVRFEYCYRLEAAINSFGQIPYCHLSIALLADLAGKATECYSALGYVDQGYLERAGFSRYVISHFIHQINFDRTHEVTTQNAEEYAA